MKTLIEASNILGLKVRTLREWAKKGKMPVTKVGNKLMIPDEFVFDEEVKKRADEGREHSKRIKAGIELGLLRKR